jgi:cell division topological specificity factor
MFESIMNFFKKMSKKEEQTLKSKDAAKERLHLVLMQDRAFLDLMKQEIIEVIKKYIDIDESAMDVRLTNKENGDGSNGAPALYANIPILNIKDEVRQTAQVKASEKEEPKKKKNEQEEKESREEENKVEERNNTKEEAKEETKKVEKQTQKTKDKKNL